MNMYTYADKKKISEDTYGKFQVSVPNMKLNSELWKTRVQSYGAKSPQ